MNTSMLIAGVVAAFVAVVVVGLQRRKNATAIKALTVGQRLPDFNCILESGESVSSQSLDGQRCVLLFVRGSWCPFCNSQVEQLTQHYRTITANGGRLIIVTPKPLDTTRRVADLFGVEFEYWLDVDLSAAQELGLAQGDPVPTALQAEFGSKTMTPAVVVIDDSRVIRFSYRSRNASDRPDPARFIGLFNAD
ncbi:MAG: redoxin domain-containing protein [Pseudomonadota bacterium]